jgi:hypothetical protein
LRGPTDTPGNRISDSSANSGLANIAFHRFQIRSDDSCRPIEVKNIMLRDLTRLKLIQVWFVAIAMVGAAVVAFGPAVTLGTAAMLFAVSLVPPAVVFALWPQAEPLTASDVLHGIDRRA